MRTRVATAATARFDRVRDGDRLPLDNFLLYEGPVSGFLDLAVWVARDDQREVDLAELLQRETGRDDVKAALATASPTSVASAAFTSARPVSRWSNSARSTSRWSSRATHTARSRKPDTGPS